MLPSLGPVGNRLAQAFRVMRRHRVAHPMSPPTVPLSRPSLSQLAQPGAVLPAFVAGDAVARRYLDLLGPLDWAHFPERSAQHP